MKHVVPERFARRARRILGPKMRFVWDEKAGKLGRPGRWQLQERGRVTHAWNYVWNVEDSLGRYVPLGDWVFKRIVEMDIAVMGMGQNAWTVHVEACEGTRRMVMQAKARESELRRQQTMEKSRLFFGERKTLMLTPSRIVLPRMRA